MLKSQSKESLLPLKIWDFMFGIEILLLWDSDIPPIFKFSHPETMQSLITCEHFHEIVAAIGENSFVGGDFFTFNFKDNICKQLAIPKTFSILNKIIWLIFAYLLFLGRWWWDNEIQVIYWTNSKKLSQYHIIPNFWDWIPTSWSP